MLSGPLVVYGTVNCIPPVNMIQTYNAIRTSCCIWYSKLYSPSKTWYRLTILSGPLVVYGTVNCILPVNMIQTYNTIRTSCCILYSKLYSPSKHDTDLKGNAVMTSWPLAVHGTVNCIPPVNMKLTYNTIRTSCCIWYSKLYSPSKHDTDLQYCQDLLLHMVK